MAVSTFAHAFYTSKSETDNLLSLFTVLKSKIALIYIRTHNAHAPQIFISSDEFSNFGNVVLVSR